MTLKVLDTDIFFYDSPDAGEEHCDCSRCHRRIKEGEEVFRIAVDNLQTSPKRGNRVTSVAAGTEFRMCPDCVKKYL